MDTCSEGTHRSAAARGIGVTRFAKIAAAAALALLLGGAGAAVSGLVPLPGGGDAPEEAAAEAVPAAAAAPAAEVVTLTQEIVVDIARQTAEGASVRAFLKARAALVYPDAAAAERGEAHALHLRDAFTDYLRQLDARDLAGSAGLARLRADLLHRARVVMGPDAPLAVLLADLVVQ